MFAFALVVSVTTGIFCGLFPGRHVLRINLNSTTGAEDPGYRFHLHESLARQSRNAVTTFERSAGYRHAHRQDALGVESRIDRSCSQRGSDEKARRHDQHNCKGHFDHDQDGPSRQPSHPGFGRVGVLQLTKNARPAMYVPMAQVPDGVTVANVKLLPIVWIARTTSDPYRVSAPMEKALESATGLPIGRVRTMREVVSESTARHQFDTWVMVTFGVSALLLAAVGVYGVIAYSVEQRTREIGIRLALGAAPADVWRMVIRHAMSFATAGIVVGIVASFYLVRLMSSLLFGVNPRDPVIFATVPMVFVVVALSAVCVPAGRATRISPMSALRYD